VSAETAESRRSRWQLQRDLERIELEIARLEAELDAVRRELSAVNPGDSGRVIELGLRHDQLDAELLAAITQWEADSDALLEAGGG
jgi:septal ring factor EnvC (AmiA/AmiB activator)